MDEIREKYRELYESYLRACEAEAGAAVIKDLRESCERCIGVLQRLFGMLELMNACGIITGREKQEEVMKLLNDFSTIRLYDAYLERGEVMAFVHRV